MGVLQRDQFVEERARQILKQSSSPPRNKLDLHFRTAYRSNFAAAAAGGVHDFSQTCTSNFWKHNAKQIEQNTAAGTTATFTSLQQPQNNHDVTSTFYQTTTFSPRCVKEQIDRSSARLLQEDQLLVDISTNDTRLMQFDQPFKLTYNARSKQLDENTFYGQPLLGQRKNSRFVKLMKSDRQWESSTLGESALNLTMLAPNKISGQKSQHKNSTFKRRNASMNYSTGGNTADQHGFLDYNFTTLSQRSPCAVINRTSDFVTGFTTADALAQR